MSLNQPQPTVQEIFKNYTPPVPAYSVVTNLLAEVPAIYLTGVDSVILTNIECGNRKKRRQKTLSRKRKVAVKDCRGLYHQQWQGIPARIELFVDNIVNGIPLWILRIPLICNLIFAEVLFHEIGHHIHYTKVPEHREREGVANYWGKKLRKSFFRRKYWYFIPLLKLILLLTWPFRKNIEYEIEGEKKEALIK